VCGTAAGGAPPLFHKDGHALVQCANCTLLYVGADPAGIDFDALYGQAYYTGGSAAVFADYVGQQAARRAHARRKLAVLRHLPPRIPRHGRLLDVGCAAGFFLVEAARHYDAQGVELSTWSSAFARERLQLKVFTGTLQQAQLPSAHFNVITLWDVIEHVPDPIALLAACRRMLRPGGRVVVVTPNMASLGRRVLGTKWYLGWGPPWHLLLFDPTTIRAVATHAGLRVAAIHTSARKARLGWTVNRLLKQHRSIPDFPAQHRSSWPLRLEAVLFQALETLAVALWPVGEELVLVAQKEPA